MARNIISGYRVSALAVETVLIDDHKMVVLGLRALFRSRHDVNVVAQAHTAEEALEVCHTHRPRVAVLDVALDGSKLDGFELCTRLRAELPELRVVFYTGSGELGIARRAFAAGGHGVVSKGDAPSELLTAVLLASRDKLYTSPAFAARAVAREFAELSGKQLETLRLLAQGLERKQIAAQMGIGEETVKTHLAAVRRKLGAQTSAQAVAIGLVNSLFEYGSESAGS